MLTKIYYFSTQFQKNKGDGKKTWETEMAVSFNTYFATEIDNPNNVPSSYVYLMNPTNTEFNFERINMTVLHYINK